jgi:phosphoribosylformylglycinamidine cyclo-ligase
MKDIVTYADAGVDLEAWDEAKDRISDLVDGTRTAAVASTFGSFGGRFRATPGRDLVASADGVGTKVKVAFMSGRHDTVGIDLVNHCVNDILAEGARPLVFMDYFACAVLEPGVLTAVVAGLAEGCRGNGCALIGGETAEMPDFYAPGEYDLAGFIVGEAAYPELLESDLEVGDVLIGLPSNGFHTNGYSLIRKLVFERMGLSVDDEFPGSGVTVADVLLKTHRSYLRELESSLEAGRIRALAHITGGGIPGNLDRALPDSLDAIVDTTTWEVPNEFEVMAVESGASREELFQTFNMGVGMIAVVREGDSEVVLSEIRDAGCEAFICGQIISGTGVVQLDGPEAGS